MDNRETELEWRRAELKARIAHYNREEACRYRHGWIGIAVCGVFGIGNFILFIQMGRWFSLVAAIICTLAVVAQIHLVREDLSIEDRL